MYAPLLEEDRNGYFDLIHQGWICVVDEHSRVLWSIGDAEDMVFYRSASKPIQALPALAMGLDKKYGLTEEQSVVLSASHLGMPCHVQAVETALRAMGLSEDILCMKPTVPGDAAANEERIRAGLPPRKVYHNCSGKHCALLMMQRELGGPVEDYWKTDTAVHELVQRTVMTVSETDRVHVGVDGCGVPVFAVPIRNIAAAYKNLACIDTIRDEALQAAAAENVRRIGLYPHMIRGKLLCTEMNRDPNIIAKGGANGVYGFGLKKQRLGVAFKLADGTESAWPFLARELLRALGALTPAHEARLDALGTEHIFNDNDDVVGRRKALFTVSL